MFAGLATAQTPSGKDLTEVVDEILVHLPTEQADTYNQRMKELLDTGVEGVKLLVGRMNTPEKDDHSAIEYALYGMACFASGDVNLKNQLEQALIATLDEKNMPTTKVFIISLMALTGSEESIRKLAVYLSDDELCSAAACAIVSIGGEWAGKELQMALLRRNARSPESQRSVIQALGDLQQPVEGLEELLIPMLITDDRLTKRIVLRTLSLTGSKQSLPNLASTVAGYRTENTDANEAYLQLIKRVHEQGDKKEAIAAAQNLLKNATKSGASPLRIAALELLFSFQPDIQSVLKTALKDGDKAYRNAALNFASESADKALYTELFKILPKAKTVEKIDLLNWIGREAQSASKKQILLTIETNIDIPGTQTLIQLLNDTDEEVRHAAIRTLGVLGDPTALPALADLLKSDNFQTLSTVKEVLAAFTKEIFPVIARAMEKASDEGKVIIMELLSERKANAYFYLVLEQTKNKHPKVQNVAFISLKNVVSEKDFVALCGLLESADPSFVEPLQQAVASSIAILSPEKQTEMITNRVLQVGDMKKYLYQPVLSSLTEK